MASAILIGSFGHLREKTNLTKPSNCWNYPRFASLPFAFSSLI